MKKYDKFDKGVFIFMSLAVLYLIIQILRVYVI